MCAVTLRPARHHFPQERGHFVHMEDALGVILFIDKDNMRIEFAPSHKRHGEIHFYKKGRYVRLEYAEGHALHGKVEYAKGHAFHKMTVYKQSQNAAASQFFESLADALDRSSKHQDAPASKPATVEEEHEQDAKGCKQTQDIEHRAAGPGPPPPPCARPPEAMQTHIQKLQREAHTAKMQEKKVTAQQRLKLERRRGIELERQEKTEKEKQRAASRARTEELVRLAEQRDLEEDMQEKKAEIERKEKIRKEKQREAESKAKEASLLALIAFNRSHASRIAKQVAERERLGAEAERKVEKAKRRARLDEQKRELTARVTAQVEFVAAATAKCQLDRAPAVSNAASSSASSPSLSRNMTVVPVSVPEGEPDAKDDQGTPSTIMVADLMTMTGSKADLSSKSQAGWQSFGDAGREILNMSYRTVQCKDAACVGKGCDKWHEQEERRLPILCRNGDACKMAKDNAKTGRLSFCRYQHYFNTPRLCQSVSAVAAPLTPPTVARPDGAVKNVSLTEGPTTAPESPTTASISGALDERTVSSTASKPKRVSNVTSDECVICMAAPNTHAMISCGHQCVCKDCGDKIMRKQGFCPMCNADIIMVVEIFK